MNVLDRLLGSAHPDHPAKHLDSSSSHSTPRQALVLERPCGELQTTCNRLTQVDQREEERAAWRALDRTVLWCPAVDGQVRRLLARVRRRTGGMLRRSSRSQGEKIRLRRLKGDTGEDQSRIPGSLCLLLLPSGRHQLLRPELRADPRFGSFRSLRLVCDRPPLRCRSLFVQARSLYSYLARRATSRSAGRVLSPSSSSRPSPHSRAASSPPDRPGACLASTKTSPPTGTSL